MSEWIATGFGALDVRGGQFAEHGDFLVASISAGDPVFLTGDGARLWQALVDGPVEDASLTAADRAIITEMAQAGFASSDVQHPHRIRAVQPPWLTSAFHELVYSVVQSVAQENSIPLVFIKGPALHAQGLRDREHSGDVDCWVAHGDDLRLAAALAPWGWDAVISPFTGTGVPHSLTLSTDGWRCAIDVHTYFPGMTVAPPRAFALLQERSEPRIYAGTSAHVPAKADNAVIAALHEARPQHQAVTSAQIERAKDPLRRAGHEVIDAVEAYGAGFALELALRGAFPEVTRSESLSPTPADWHWRSITSGPRRHLAALRLVAWRDRPRVIFRLLWPDNRSTQALAGDATIAAPRRAALRLRRVGRALVDLVRPAP